jgi:hypothetical protein
MSVVQYQTRDLSNDKNSAVEWLIKVNYICFGTSRGALFSGINAQLFCAAYHFNAHYSVIMVSHG